MASSASLGTPRVHKIVITGGPCAGKTTAMAQLSMRLTNMGFAVYVVPELATLTITGGAAPGTMTRPQLVSWETAILRSQLGLEDTFEEIANHCNKGQHSVLLCDRGTMDVLAYLGHETFTDILEENDWTVAQLRDKRYDAVVHLVTAAIGAESFYTLENNKARMESSEEAIALDGRLSRAWVGHNKLHIVENTGSFEDKMVRTTQAVCESLGVPSPSIKPRWWIVEIDPALNGVPPLDVEHVECVLEHTFLKTMNNHIESRVTRKSQPMSTTYHHRVRGEIVGDEHSAAERTISFREYKALLSQADPTRETIKKTRRAFIWNNEYFLLDTFHSPVGAAGTVTLFIEKPVPDRFHTAAHVPPFITLKQDVTTQDWFSSYAHDSWRRTMAMAAEQQSNKRVTAESVQP